MAAIIKAGQLHNGTETARCVEFNLTDMSQNASDYLVSVKKQATRIINDAQQQATKMRNDAELSGRKAAIDAAKQDAIACAEANWRALEPALAEAIRSVNELRTEWVNEWERHVVQLAVAIAERIIRSEVQQRPEITQEWIRAAVELMASCGRVQLHMNPKDHEILGDQRQAIADQFNNLAATDIIADPAIEAGGCRVTSDHGHVDHQIETQLQRIKEELSS